ncbi:hypothetical protein Tco_0725152 [Tanacetum coccineum]|uniref:Uncharacterized protein n=1 Tax=Tanacetum coccineum TaxID=301880 RepID=A0ABQ4YE85_9ASTR
MPFLLKWIILSFHYFCLSICSGGEDSRVEPIKEEEEKAPEKGGIGDMAATNFVGKCLAETRGVWLPLLQHSLERNLSCNELLRKGTKYYSKEFSRFYHQKMSGIIKDSKVDSIMVRAPAASVFLAAK